MNHYFRILKKDARTRGRTGILETSHGIVETPVYVIVGTHGKVRTLDSRDLTDAGTQLIISNTYHLWQKLGDAGLASFQGLHAYMDWPRPLMTDSGGFQVFSLGIAREQGVSKVAQPEESVLRHREANLVRITEEGVFFSDGGPEQFLNAERSMAIQAKLGADIIFAFDEPTSPHHDYVYTKEAMERTHRWAVRSRNAAQSNQMLYGIVQGGAFADLREESARYIGSLDFEGFGIGGAFGTSFGDTAEDTFKELEWTIPFLPEEKPRHFLGIGLVQDLFAGVERGIDTFDCVVPTREARHGSIWTRGARIDITRGRHNGDTAPLDSECGCHACAEMHTTRGDLYTLFREKNEEAGRLASIHNVYFFNHLMSDIRAGIRDDRLQEVKQHYLFDLKLLTQ